MCVLVLGFSGVGLMSVFGFFKRSFAFFSEFFVWFFLSSSFLFMYVNFFGASVSVVLPHVAVILSFWLGLISLRLLVWRCFFEGRLKKVVVVSLLVLPLIVLLLWYVVVLVGLSSWGRVTTWPLMKIYILQASQVSSVMGFSSWFFLIFAAFVFSPILILYKFLPGFDWCAGASKQASTSSLMLISFFCFMVFLVQYYRLYNSIEMHYQEPLSISFFDGSPSLQQSHSLIGSPVIDAAEDAAYSSYKPKNPFKARNVILIIGDALRADHMGVYGYQRSTTPFLEKAVEHYQTIVVPSVRSVCSESSCGLRAISSSRPLHLFPRKPLTLHEVLRRHGYGINLVLSGDHTNFYGLKDSYGQVDNYFDGMHQGARYINDDSILLDYLSGLSLYDGRKPLFFQFHLMSTHGLGMRHKSSEVFLPFTNYYRWPSSAEGRKAPSVGDVSHALNYYDNGVLQFDKIAHEILDILESKGYLDDALVVYTGDHGEMLGEKGIFGHQRRVDDEVLHIPLIIQRRGYSGGGIGKWPLASQVDIAPTILSELGMHSPEVWRGVSLQSQSVPRFIDFQQTPNVGMYVTGKSGGILKYWKDMSTSQEFLYDIEADPSESSNIVNSLRYDDLDLWRGVILRNAVSK